MPSRTSPVVRHASRSRARRAVPALALLLLAGGLAACSSDDDAAPEDTRGVAAADGLVRAAVASLPTTAHDEFVLMVADLDRATELGGLSRPDDPSDEDAFMTWLLELSGTRGGDLAVEVPDIFGGASVREQDEVADEIGTWMGDARWFAELSAPPSRVSVVEGPIDVAHLEATYGADGADGDGGRWKVGEGDDHWSDLANRTAVRPLGQPLHLDVEGDRLTASFTEPDLELALARDRGSASALAVAEALDAHDVYTARIVAGNLAGGASALPGAFDTVAIGMTGEDGDVQVVAAYAHADASDARANADAVATAIVDDPQAPPLEVTGTEVDGEVLTVTFRVTDDGPPRVAWSVLLNRAPVFSHR
ncbi:MAG TPA: hypothetical protein VGE77_12330 [Nocardioides sp.]